MTVIFLGIFIVGVIAACGAWTVIELDRLDTLEQDRDRL
jgi:hypothetical protein